MYRIGKYSAGQKKNLKGVLWNHKLQSSIKDTREGENWDSEKSSILSGIFHKHILC